MYGFKEIWHKWLGDACCLLSKPEFIDWRIAIAVLVKTKADITKKYSNYHFSWCMVSISFDYLRELLLKPTLSIILMNGLFEFVLPYWKYRGIRSTVWRQILQDVSESLEIGYLLHVYKLRTYVHGPTFTFVTPCIYDVTFYVLHFLIHYFGWHDFCSMYIEAVH